MDLKKIPSITKEGIRILEKYGINSVEGFVRSFKRKHQLKKFHDSFPRHCIVSYKSLIQWHSESKTLIRSKNHFSVLTTFLSLFPQFQLLRFGIIGFILFILFLLFFYYDEINHFNKVFYYWESKSNKEVSDVILNSNLSQHNNIFIAKFEQLGNSNFDPSERIYIELNSLIEAFSFLKKYNTVPLWKNKESIEVNEENARMILSKFNNSFVVYGNYNDDTIRVSIDSNSIISIPEMKNFFHPVRDKFLEFPVSELSSSSIKFYMLNIWGILESLNNKRNAEGFLESFSNKRNAESLFKESLKIADKYNIKNEYKSDVCYRLANIYFSTGEQDLVLEYLNRSIDYNDRNSYAYGDRAFYYILKKNYEMAIKDCLKALEIEPKSMDSLMNIINCYSIVGNVTGETKYRKKWFDYYYGTFNLGPDIIGEGNANALIVNYEKLEMYGEAINIAEKMIKSSNDDSKWNLILSLMYKKKLDWDKSLYYLESVKVDKENQLTVSEIKFYCYFYLDEFEKALDELKKIVEFDESQQLNLLIYAYQLLLKHDYYLRFKSNNNQNNSIDKSENFVKFPFYALKSLEEYSKRNSNDYRTLNAKAFCLCNIYFLNNDMTNFKKSISLFEESNKINENIVALHNLIYLYELIGDKQKSNQILVEYRKKYPKSKLPLGILLLIDNRTKLQNWYNPKSNLLLLVLNINLTQ